MTMEQTTSGKEIIDATQNAVIEAAENVSKAIEHTASSLDAHHEAFYLSAEFWVAMSFVLVVAALGRPIYKIIRSLLRKRIQGIIRRIEEASKLQDEAQILLADYERKFLGAKDEAETILKKAQNEIEYYKRETLSRLEQDMKQKEKDAEERLNSAKEKASQEISALAGNLTIKAVKAAAVKYLDDKTQAKLIDQSIALLTKIK